VIAGQPTLRHEVDDRHGITVMGAFYDLTSGAVEFS
jgi:hypothetical protein